MSADLFFLQRIQRFNAALCMGRTLLAFVLSDDAIVQ
jgi:hypothetical protein